MCDETQFYKIGVEVHHSEPVNYVKVSLLQRQISVTLHGAVISHDGFYLSNKRDRNVLTLHLERDQITLTDGGVSAEIPMKRSWIETAVSGMESLIEKVGTRFDSAALRRKTMILIHQILGRSLHG
jgi:hypothetical protein